MLKYDREFLKQNLYSGVLCDVMDKMGYSNQGIGNKIMPVENDTVIFGPAFTSIATIVYSMPENPLTAQCKVVDRLCEDEIYVLVTRGDYNCAVFGELFATAVKAKKGAGVLLDGYARDLKAIKEMGFPLFYAGRDPRSSKGRAEINECQIPVIMAGVTIRPGDYIFGDIDGVAIIPKELCDEVFTEALQVIKSEDVVREGLLNGDSLEQVYLQHGTI